MLKNSIAMHEHLKPYTLPGIEHMVFYSGSGCDDRSTMPANKYFC
jgi:hypothetical protein